MPKLLRYSKKSEWLCFNSMPKYIFYEIDPWSRGKTRLVTIQIYTSTYPEQLSSSCKKLLGWLDQRKPTLWQTQLCKKIVVSMTILIYSQTHLLSQINVQCREEHWLWPQVC